MKCTDVASGAFGEHDQHAVSCRVRETRIPEDVDVRLVFLPVTVEEAETGLLHHPAENRDVPRVKGRDQTHRSDFFRIMHVESSQPKNFMNVQMKPQSKKV